MSAILHRSGLIWSSARPAPSGRLGGLPPGFCPYLSFRACRHLALYSALLRERAFFARAASILALASAMAARRSSRRRISLRQIHPSGHRPGSAAFSRQGQQFLDFGFGAVFRFSDVAVRQGAVAEALA